MDVRVSGPCLKAIGVGHRLRSKDGDRCTAVTIVLLKRTGGTKSTKEGGQWNRQFEQVNLM